MNRGKGSRKKLKEEIGDLLNALESIIYIEKWDEKQLRDDRLKKLLKYHSNL